MKLVEKLKKLFRRKKPIVEEEIEIIGIDTIIVEKLPKDVDALIIAKSTPRKSVRPRNSVVVVRKPGSQATRRDYSKFMKGSKHQLKDYRISVKQKVKPEEED